jgi:hypothetical protein
MRWRRLWLECHPLSCILPSCRVARRRGLLESGRRCLLLDHYELSVPPCSRTHASFLPVHVPGAGCRRLLTLGRGNATLDREGGAVGARDAQGGGIAANLSSCYALVSHAAGNATITYFPCMTCCEWWLAIVFRPAEVPRLVNNVDITPRPRSRVCIRAQGRG